MLTPGARANGTAFMIILCMPICSWLAKPIMTGIVGVGESKIGMFFPKVVKFTEINKLGENMVEIKPGYRLFSAVKLEIGH
jgi:hypothetical protein